jgi:hypothetical protein
MVNTTKILLTKHTEEVPKICNEMCIHYILDHPKSMNTLKSKFTLQLHMHQADPLLVQALCFQLVGGVILLRYHSVRWQLEWAETFVTKLDCQAGASKTILNITRMHHTEI